jgi:hypothetical protein
MQKIINVIKKEMLHVPASESEAYTPCINDSETIAHLEAKFKSSMKGSEQVQILQAWHVLVGIHGNVTDVTGFCLNRWHC